MQYKLIVYKRIKNLGNYESEHLEMSAELEENEDPVEVSRHLRRLVNDILKESVYPKPVSKDVEDFDF